MVPLVIDEPSSSACGELWDGADSITSTRLTYIEVVAALAQAERLGRLTPDELQESRLVLDALWPVVDVIELDAILMSEAAQAAVTHGLRGYDATHFAAAVAVNDAELVAVSGDQRLLSAWRAEGVAVRDTST